LAITADLMIGYHATVQTLQQSVYDIVLTTINKTHPRLTCHHNPCRKYSRPKESRMMPPPGLQI